MAERPVKRSYHSPKRAEQALETRRRIRSTAERLFLRDGYLPTSMKSIAGEAGVAERTLYLAFPTKAALLHEIIVVALRGHDRDEPLSESPAVRSAFEAPAGELIPRFAQAVAVLMGRAARVLAIGEAAATADPALVAFRERGHAAQRADAHELAEALQERGELAAGMTVDQAADTIFALAANEAVYLRLVEECGFGERDFADWLGKVLTATLTWRQARYCRA